MGIILKEYIVPKLDFFDDIVEQLRGEFIVSTLECLDTTDDLIRVILSKNFSDKQVKIDAKLLEYILKNINRSYEDIFDLINKLDNLSLSTGKSININLIKKVLKK